MSMEHTDFQHRKARELARVLALLENQRRSSLPVALALVSADRSVISANRAFRRMFGIRADELNRKNLYQIVPSDELIEKIRDVHAQGRFQADLFHQLRAVHFA